MLNQDHSQTYYGFGLDKRDIFAICTTTSKGEQSIRPTLSDIQSQARKAGFVVTKTDGEYRVARKGKVADTEASAYYTNDIEDAAGTLPLMIAEVN